MSLDSLLDQQSSWLRSNGPSSDVVVSSRIRIARNISGFPFVGQADDSDRVKIAEQIAAAAKDVLPEGSYRAKNWTTTI